MVPPLPSPGAASYWSEAPVDVPPTPPSVLRSARWTNRPATAIGSSPKTPVLAGGGGALGGLAAASRGAHAAAAAAAAGACICVLDIFGFESFAANGFEQLMINYTNEKLQQLFSRLVLEEQQAEYISEGIETPPPQLEYTAAAESTKALELIEAPQGLLSLLEEQCLLGDRGSDSGFYRSLATRHTGVPCLDLPKVHSPPGEFVVRHYAGEVRYWCGGFLERNRESLSTQLGALLAGSGDSLMRALFRDMAAEQPQTAPRTAAAGTLAAKSYTPAATPGGAAPGTYGTPRRRGGGTQAANFKLHLNALVAKMGATRCHFVRCINPNAERLPFTLEPPLVAQQLSCGGLLHAVRLARSGYPARFQLDAFWRRFAPLSHALIGGEAGSPPQTGAPVPNPELAAAAAETARAATARAGAPVRPEALRHAICALLAFRLGEESLGDKSHKSLGEEEPPADKPLGDKSLGDKSLGEEESLSSSKPIPIKPIPICAIGRSKVFLKTEALLRLQAALGSHRSRTATRLQAKARANAQRRGLLAAIRASCKMQGAARGAIARVRRRRRIEAEQGAAACQLQRAQRRRVALRRGGGGRRRRRRRRRRQWRGRRRRSRARRARMLQARLTRLRFSPQFSFPLRLSSVTRPRRFRRLTTRPHRLPPLTTRPHRLPSPIRPPPISTPPTCRNLRHPMPPPLTRQLASSTSASRRFARRSIARRRSTRHGTRRPPPDAHRSRRRAAWTRSSARCRPPAALPVAPRVFPSASARGAQ